MSSAPVIIVGTGLAGYTLAREFRKLDPDTPLTLISRDAGGFYSKPMLSNALASHKAPAALVSKDAGKMAEELRARIIPNAEVAAIAPDRHSLRLADGQEMPYRDLVLAWGADPIRLPLEGDGAADVLSVNSLEDYAVFAGRLASARTVAILGAGLIGCEFANDLLARQIRPVVIDPAQWPLSRLLPEKAGRHQAAGLEKAGVEFRWQATVQRVDRQGNGYALTLSDGSFLAADLLLSAVGLRPRTEVAAQAGLECSRGIVTDRRLATSAPHIHALGDCAEVAGLTLPFVLPIMQQARALAKTLAGTPSDVTYPAMPVVVKTPASPAVVCPPPVGAQGSWQVEQSESGVEALFRDGAGTVLGFALVGSAVGRRQALTPLVPALLP